MAPYLYQLSWYNQIPYRAVQVRALGGDIVLFGGKTLYAHSAFLHPGVLKWVTANLMLGVYPQRTNIPSTKGAGS